MSAIPHMNDQHVDAGVPWHYGEPFKEQQSILSHRAGVDLSHHGVVTVTGPDRMTWLHSLTTQDFLTPFTSTHALILSPHGHIEHDLHVIDDGETVWLIVEPGTAPALAAYLDSMRFMLRVDVADVSATFAVVGHGGHVVSELPTWHSPNAFIVGSGVVDPYVPERPTSWEVSEVIVARAQLEEYLSHWELAGTWAWEAVRVAAGVPRLNIDTDHRTIPHEVGLISAAVHLHKGCYRGQETIARVINLGKPPRKLVQLNLDGSINELPMAGSDIELAGKVIGFVGSVVQHFEEGPIGLGVIKKSVDSAATVVCGEVAASQTPIVVV